MNNRQKLFRLLGTLLLLICISITKQLPAQGMGMYERKWIVQNDSVYGIKCFKQIGQFSVVSRSSLMDSAVNRALPLGRKVQTNFNPMVFDIHKGFLYGLNNTEFAQNDPMMAFKKINIRKLKSWDQVDSFGQLMMEAAEANRFIDPTPAFYARKNFKPLKSFYTDISLSSENNIREVVYVNGLLMNWKYDGKKWNLTDSVRTEMNSYFSCFSLKDKNYMIDETGNVYDLEDHMKVVARTGCLLDTHLLIVDKDHSKLYKLPYLESNFKDYSLDQWIKVGAAISIFEPQ